MLTDALSKERAKENAAEKYTIEQITELLQDLMGRFKK
jgi:hypothetical protein